MKFHSFRRKFRSAKFPTAKIPFGENSARRNFRSAKIPFGENSFRRKFIRRKFLRRKLLRRKFLAPRKMKQHSTVGFLQVHMGPTQTAQTMDVAVHYVSISVDVLLFIQIKPQKESVWEELEQLCVLLKNSAILLAGFLLPHICALLYHTSHLHWLWMSQLYKCPIPGPIVMMIELFYACRG